MSWRRRIKLEFAVAEGAGVAGFDLVDGVLVLAGVEAMVRARYPLVSSEF